MSMERCGDSSTVIRTEMPSCAVAYIKSRKSIIVCRNSIQKKKKKKNQVLTKN